MNATKSSKNCVCELSLLRMETLNYMVLSNWSNTQTDLYNLDLAPASRSREAIPTLSL